MIGFVIYSKSKHYKKYNTIMIKKGRGWIMSAENSKASQSEWFRQYEEEVNGAKNASGSKKGILVIIPLLLIGGAIAMMINNGALENEQTKGGVYALAGVGVVLILMILILTSKSKKKDAAEITRKDLDAILTSEEIAQEFDKQIKAEPILKVVNKTSKDNFIFFTEDFIGTKFLVLGDKTYRFAKRSDLAVLHTVTNNSGSVDVEFRNDKGDILLTWVAENAKKVDELKAALTSISVDLKSM